MFFSKFLRITSFYLICQLIGIAPLFASDEAGLYMTVHNVGQGSFTSLKFIDEEGIQQHMIYDCGSSSYKKEFKYTQRTIDENSHFLTPLRRATSTPPNSVKKKSDFHRIISATHHDSDNFGKEAYDIGPYLKQARQLFLLEAGNGSNPRNTAVAISIRTLVISHPDVDHYNWVSKLFSHEDDFIKYIILGGLPQQYDRSGRLEFKRWLRLRLEGGTKIFIPSISDQFIESIEDAFKDDEKRPFHPQFFCSPGEEKTIFGGAFDFGQHFSVCPLMINASFIHMRNKVVRFAYDKDDNIDSIVLRVACGNRSLMLTGDATGLTTTSLLSAFDENLDILLSDVLVASHHGSAENGSNDKRLIEVIKPKICLISNGASQNHPQAAAYECLKTSSRLKMASKHTILVGPCEKFDKGSLHETNRAIFSTLTNGDLKVSFSTTGVMKLMMKGRQVDLRDFADDDLSDLEEPVEVEENAEEVFATPIKKH